MTYDENYANRATIFDDGDIIEGDHIKAIYDKLGASPGGTAEIVPKTDSFILSIDEAGAVVEMTSASATVVTVPPQADVQWTEGTTVSVRQTGTGGVSIAAGAGVTIRNSDVALSVQYSELLLHRRAENDWIIVSGRVAVPDGLDTTGTPSSSTFLDGTGAWQTPTGGTSVPIIRDYREAYRVPVTSSTTSLVEGRRYYIPVPVVPAESVTAMSINVTVVGSAGAICRLALYESKANGSPGDLIEDLGTVAVDSGVEVKTLTLATPYTVPVGVGVLWAMCHPDDAAATKPTLRVTSNSSSPLISVAPSDITKTVLVGSTSYPGGLITAALNDAAAPDPAPSDLTADRFIPIVALTIAEDS